MVSQARQRLSEDHHAVSKLLKQLLTALDNKDIQTSYSRVDLLWARLAVHIRAEHLHLFPAIASRVTEAQPEIDRLRADHDFFMSELARAVGILHELSRRTAIANDDPKLTSVGNAVREIGRRLGTHDEVEENQIYLWSSTILTEPEQAKLLARINAELDKRPPRFSRETWANCP
jgi:hemerythrin superfamily protein